MASASTVVQDLSPWAPLKTPMFRAFWFASLASNFGTWIHEVGAQWLMTSLDSTPEMVSAVRTVMTLPIVLLAIPAGVLADRIDRRRLLLATQFGLFSATATLATLTRANWITPWGLLGLTFLIGLGMVLHVPTWQASVPELVPRAQIPRAVALGSISFNLARAIGPATGGVLIALFGIWVAFAINACSFLGVIFVLLSWHRERTESSRGLTFRHAMWQGLRYVTGKPTMRHVLIGVVLFVMPGSALWSLLPLVARERLHWNADGFGLLVATIGVGAVFAAWLLPRVQRSFGVDRTIAGAMTIFAIGIGVVSRTTVPWLVVSATLVMGAGWMMTLTTLNATAQVTLPRPLRARGMGCYLTAMAFSMSLGSLIWGQVAGHFGVATALLVASVTLLATAAISLAFKLGSPLS